MVSATSCESYLLEENPNQVTTESYWNDLEDTKATIYAAYARLRSDYVLNIRAEAWRSDMAWPGYGRPQVSNNAMGWTYYIQNYNNSNTLVMNKWDNTYTIIWRANQAIEGLQKLESNANIDKEEWSKQMAEARFVRGLAYFYLYTSFNEGSVILKKETPKNNEAFYEPLAPAEDVYNFYVADLEYAYKNLPDVSPEVSLPAKPAAATILGTSYLYKSDYAKAAPYFVDVITNGNYGLKLEQDITKMFTTAGEFNSESIFEIPYSTELRTDYVDWAPESMRSSLGLYSKSQMGYFMPSWLVNEYLTEEMDPKVSSNYTDGTNLRAVSQRASAMCALMEDQTSLYYNKYVAEQTEFGGAQGAWGFGKYKKYSNSDIMDLEPANLPISGKNVTVNRLSDVYLMYAECLLHDGDIQKSLDYINAIRKRWGLVLLGSGADASRTYDGVTYTKESLMDRIMYIERPLELSVEGHQTRWQDLRRWGLLNDDAKNIFKRHAAEVFYTTSPTGLKKVDGTDATTAPKHSSITAIEPTTGTAGTDYYVIDYEYDEAAKNYSVKNNLYYGISANEILNNPNL